MWYNIPMKYRATLLFILFGITGLFSLENDWKELEIAMGESVWASSSLTETLKGKRVTYGPEALFDGDISKPWVEGTEGSGENESVLIQTQKMVSAIDVTNGFASSTRLFARNNRIKDFEVSFTGGLTAPGLVTELDYTLYFVQETRVDRIFSLADSPVIQKVSLTQWESLQEEFYREVISRFARDYPDFYAMILQDLGIPPEEGEGLMYQKLIMDVYGFFGIRITIRDVYRGTHYDDTCLSELNLLLEEF